MQTPEITEPAGAGDVPTQNYKMIGALAVKSGQLERAELPGFVKKHGSMDLLQHKDIFHQEYHLWLWKRKIIRRQIR